MRLWVEMFDYWNIFRLRKVSLLVRLWVEILRTSESLHQYIVSLLVRLWVEMESLFDNYNLDNVSLLVRLWVEIMSISWDPEPKNVSLLVRLWVEILLPTALKSAVRRQPPCEAVSWNIWFWLCCCSSTVSLLVRLWVEIIFCHHYTMLRFVSLLVRLWVEIFNLTTIIWNIICQPPCEAVSWNVIASFLTASKEGQPPCEAVSWNEVQVQSGLYCHGQPPCEAVSWNSFSMASFTSLDVSLLVRLWVEMFNTRRVTVSFSSASLWGCELKCQSWQT